MTAVNSTAFFQRFNPGIGTNPPGVVSPERITRIAEQRATNAEDTVEIDGVTHHSLAHQGPNAPTPRHRLDVVPEGRRLESSLYGYVPGRDAPLILGQDLTTHSLEGAFGTLQDACHHHQKYAEYFLTTVQQDTEVTHLLAEHGITDLKSLRDHLDTYDLHTSPLGLNGWRQVISAYRDHIMTLDAQFQDKLPQLKDDLLNKLQEQGLPIDQEAARRRLDNTPFHVVDPLMASVLEYYGAFYANSWVAYLSAQALESPNTNSLESTFIHEALHVLSARGFCTTPGDNSSGIVFNYRVGLRFMLFTDIAETEHEVSYPSGIGVLSWLDEGATEYLTQQLHGESTAQRSFDPLLGIIKATFAPYAWEVEMVEFLLHILGDDSHLLWEAYYENNHPDEEPGQAFNRLNQRLIEITGRDILLEMDDAIRAGNRTQASDIIYEVLDDALGE